MQGTQHGRPCVFFSGLLALGFRDVSKSPVPPCCSRASYGQTCSIIGLFVWSSTLSLPRDQALCFAESVPCAFDRRFHFSRRVQPGWNGKGPQSHLLNLFESPGHVDVGAVRQALAERVIPNLSVIKVDRCILELQMEQRRNAQSIQKCNFVDFLHWFSVGGRSPYPCLASCSP